VDGLGRNFRLHDQIHVLAMSAFEYLATPYSEYAAGLEEAYKAALMIVVDFVKQGRCVYSPVVHSHPVARAGMMDPLDHKLWMALDEPFMRAAGSLIVAMLPGWKESMGVHMEIEHFIAAGKPIVYYDPEEGMFE
jgi:Domain of unknown function (DUF1937)